MAPYEAVGVAVAATAILSVAVVEYLFRALRGVLSACYVEAPLARFWAAFAHVAVLLIPTLIQLFALGFMTPPTTVDWLWVVELVKWGLLGLLISVGMVGLGVLAFAQGRSLQLWVPPEQAAELQQMLDRVREFRAKDVVRRAERVKG